jgi:hypothetical protein
MNEKDFQNFCSSGLQPNHVRKSVPRKGFGDFQFSGERENGLARVYDRNTLLAMYGLDSYANSMLSYYAINNC